MIGNGLERLATEIHEIIARIPVRRHRTQITVLQPPSPAAGAGPLTARPRMLAL